MPTTYEPIATTTVSNSTTNNVTFTSISSSFTDLILVYSGGLDPSANEIEMQVNGDTGTNYSYTYVIGTGSSALSGRASNNASGYLGGAGDSLSQGVAIAHFLNYSNTTTYKTFITRTGWSNRFTGAVVNLWRSTSAINSIKLKNGNSSQYLSSGTVITLYGIKAA